MTETTNSNNAPLNNGACQAYCAYLTDLKPLNCNGCSACNEKGRYKHHIDFEG